MGLRGLIVRIYDALRRLVAPLDDLVDRVDEGFLCVVLDARDLVIPRGDLRLSRIGCALRILLDAGEGLGDGEVDARSVLRLLCYLGRIDAEAIRLICVASAECVMLIDLTPCYL